MGRKRKPLGAPGADDVTYEGACDPLLMALFQGDDEGAVRMLEAGGCNVEAADQLGWRPLHRAAFGGLRAATASLLTRRAEVAVADKDGLQPLHIAAAGGHVSCCQLLVAAGADPTTPDGYSGLSAQMYALQHGDDEAGKQLQDSLGGGSHGADIASWAAWGDPLAMAGLAAGAGEDEKGMIEERWSAQLGAEVDLSEAADAGGSSDDEPQVSRAAGAAAQAVQEPPAAAPCRPPE